MVNDCNNDLKQNMKSHLKYIFFSLCPSVCCATAAFHSLWFGFVNKMYLLYSIEWI